MAPMAPAPTLPCTDKVSGVPDVIDAVADVFARVHADISTEYPPLHQSERSIDEKAAFGAKDVLDDFCNEWWDDLDYLSEALDVCAAALRAWAKALRKADGQCHGG